VDEHRKLLATTMVLCPCTSYHYVKNLNRRHGAHTCMSQRRHARFIKGHGSGVRRIKGDVRLKCSSPFTYRGLKGDKHLHDASPFTYNI
jgi:hypothetical protein